MSEETKEGGEILAGEPRKITLKRQSKTEIKVQRSSGRKGTVSIVRKKRHIYVKKDASSIEEEQVNEETNISESAVAALPADPVITETKDIKDIKATLEPVLSEKAAEVPVAKKEEKGSATKRDRASRASLDEEDKKRAKNKPKVRTEADDWHKGNVANVLSIIGTEEVEDVDVESNGEGTLQEKPEIRLSSRRHGRSKFKSAAATKEHKKELKNVLEEIQKKHNFEKPSGPLVRAVELPETITVAELAQKMSAKVSDVIRTLMKLGTIATINQSIDRETATILVEELGHTAKIVNVASIESLLQPEETRELLPRAAIVTVMGHVDHGKTSLLDYIRTTKVAAKEAGGITQHIGAYHVRTSRGDVTFLDTPGHAAFTAMRARGVQCTDLVILVVAADDGVMPQTIEAIQHAKAGNVPIVVAINKIDKKDADLDRIYNELSVHGLVPEAWGGDVIFVPVSAKEGTGIDALLEAVGLQAEMLELKAPVVGNAIGVVLEARLDKGRGAIASLLVQKGTLKRGDILLAGAEYGRVRAMMNELGQQIDSIGPAMPVEVLGLSGTPQAGDTFQVVSDERKAKEVALLRQVKHRDVRMLRKQSSKLEGLFDHLQQVGSKTLNIVLKTDVQGSAEALVEALEGLSTDQVKVKIIAMGVGGINESDISLSIASSALLIGFNVRADASARRLSERESFDIYYSSIIYDVVDNIKRAINGLLGPQFKEQILGLAEVRTVFRSAKLGAVAGCMVIEGVIKRGCPIRVLRNNVVIYQGELESLRRFKDDVSEVRNATECGIGVKNYNDVKVGDQIEVYETIEVVRS